MAIGALPQSKRIFKTLYFSWGKKQMNFELFFVIMAHKMEIFPFSRCLASLKHRVSNGGEPWYSESQDWHANCHRRVNRSTEFHGVGFGEECSKQKIHKNKALRDKNIRWLKYTIAWDKWMSQPVKARSSLRPLT